MSITYSQSVPLRGKRPGRNEPCWCNSGKKYKKCHLISDQTKEVIGSSALTPPIKDADLLFDDLCGTYGIPLTSRMVIQWSRERIAKDFDLSPMIGLFAAYAPGNAELRRLCDLLFHVLRNHPGKPDPTVSLDDPNRISQYAFDIPDIDQQTTEGKVNKALALTKAGDYLTALDLYALALPHINEIDERFRVYLNIGVCLVECGQMELAHRYFEQSLREKPDYAIAKNNISLFTNTAVTERQHITGRGILFLRVLQNQKWLDTVDITASPLLSDIRAFLLHIEHKRVSITAKQRLISLRDAKRINQLFCNPDPDIKKLRSNGKTLSWEAKTQWEYPKLSWIYAVCRWAGLLRFEKGTLKLSRVGRLVFLTEPPSRQLAWLWKEWIAGDWATLIPSGWTYEFETELMDQTQDLIGPILSCIGHISSPFTAVESLGDRRKKHAEEKFAVVMLASRIERFILDPLVWMGILTAPAKRSLFSKDRTFTVTQFGRAVLDTLIFQSDSALPAVIRDFSRSE